MILHGIERRTSCIPTRSPENLSDMQENDRFDVVLANPPFGGKERREIQQNFPIQTGETAFLFLQHFIKRLKAGGRAAIVIKNTFLSNSDSAARSLRKELLESCNLHTMLDCPAGTFLGRRGKNRCAIFRRRARRPGGCGITSSIRGGAWGKRMRSMMMTCGSSWRCRRTSQGSERSWSVDVRTIDPTSLDPVGQEPQQGRTDAGMSRSEGDHRRDASARCRERRDS